MNLITYYCASFPEAVIAHVLQNKVLLKTENTCAEVSFQ